MQEMVKKIMEDPFIWEVMHWKSFEEAKGFLYGYIKDKFDDKELSKKVASLVFIEYLEFRKGKVDNPYFYEDTLLYLMQYLENDVIKYFLSKDLDFDHIGFNHNCSNSTLLEEVSNSINNKEKMNLFLDKINSLDICKFINSKKYDLCTMNIRAGRLDNALIEFKKFSVDDEVICKLKNSKQEGIIFENYDLRIMDELNKVFYEIQFLDEKLKDKIVFIKNVIYSSNIKIFNKENLSFIKSILSMEEYNNYIDYLKNNDIVLYTIENKLNPKVFLEEFETVKTLKLVP